LSEHEATHALLERLRHAERASWGVDPDSMSYLDAADRIDRARAAYRAQLAEHGQVVATEERLATLVGVAREGF
jgi:hypothetical protein